MSPAAADGGPGSTSCQCQQRDTGSVKKVTYLGQTSRQDGRVPEIPRQGGHTMSNVRLRTEDADPAMIPGYFGVSYFSGAASKRSRSSLNKKVLFRNGRAISVSEETV